jgi:hypothetical protein
MKMKHFNILTIMLFGLLVMFSACEDKDDYDYNAIEPIISSITGPGEVAAHGLVDFPTRFHVPHRGGSTFAWEVGGHGAQSIVLDEDYPSVAYITFKQSSDTTAATITVVETTEGNKVSEPFSRDIVLTPFCPVDMDALTGEWVGTSPNNDDVLIAGTTGNLNELTIKGLAGFINFAWGENWTSGDGTALLDFRCGNLVVIEEQVIGETDYPDTYKMDGVGTFDFDNQTITLTYVVYYTGGSTGEIETTLTRAKMKNGEYGFVVVK